MSDIQLNEDLIKHNLKDLVRNSVEETLNALLDKGADELVNADKYEQSADRQGYHFDHYKQNLLLKKHLSRCILPVFLSVM